jgi:hypothetical protein
LWRAIALDRQHIIIPSALRFSVTSLTRHFGWLQMRILLSLIPYAVDVCKKHDRLRNLTRDSFFFIEWGGTYVTRYCGHFGPIVQPQMIDEDDCGAIGGMKIGVSQFRWVRVTYKTGFGLDGWIY